MEAFEDLDKIEITAVTFEVVPQGVYDAQITNITKVIGKKFQSEEEEVKIQFEFTILDGAESGKKLIRRVNTKLGDTPGKESTLYKLACAALGKKLKRDENGGFSEFHLSDLKNAIVKIVVEVTEKDGKTFNDIVSYMKADNK